MATVRLDERRVRTLKPRKSAYDIRDRELKGFGIRVMPSGAKRHFIHSQHQGQRVWKIVGRDGAIGPDEARKRARTLLASIREETGTEAVATADNSFETVAEEVFRRYARNWKPSTLRVNLGYYRNQILPWFEGRPIADITAHDVQRWFASLHETPVAADRSAPILSVIMRQAEVYGYRPEGSNPCVGIKRYRRQGRERFLSSAEISRLGEVLARHENDQPQIVAIIRLLLLTGCRKSEIVTLKWSFYREGKLFLPDSKTGPRHVLLGKAARELLNRLSKTRSGEWVFPGTAREGHMSEGALYLFWRRVRDEAGIVADARLHDLRHSHASHAIMNGESLHIAGCLLGHRRAATTNHYAHLDDVTLRKAAERVALAVERKMQYRHVIARVADGKSDEPLEQWPGNRDRNRARIGLEFGLRGRETKVGSAGIRRHKWHSAGHGAAVPPTAGDGGADSGRQPSRPARSPPPALLLWSPSKRLKGSSKRIELGSRTGARPIETRRWPPLGRCTFSSRNCRRSSMSSAFLRRGLNSLLSMRRILSGKAMFCATLRRG